MRPIRFGIKLALFATCSVLGTAAGCSGDDDRVSREVISPDGNKPGRVAVIIPDGAEISEVADFIHSELEASQMPYRITFCSVPSDGVDNFLEGDSEDAPVKGRSYLVHHSGNEFVVETDDEQKLPYVNCPDTNGQRTFEKSVGGKVMHDIEALREITEDFHEPFTAVVIFEPASSER